MQFTWEVPSSAKSYDVEIKWSTDGINFSNIDTIAGDTTAPPPPYTHTKADTRTINRYRIRLVISSTSNTYSPYSNVIGPL